MKKLLYVSFVVVFGLLLSQCNKEPQDNTEGAKEGGYITVDNANLNYVVGDGSSYSFNMTVHQNADFKVSKIHLYKSAVIYDKIDSVSVTTNEILEKTIDVSGSDPITLNSGDFAYPDLIAGLTVNGTALPESDGELSIGDKFVFRVVSELSDGSKYQQAYKVNLTVSTRFAGTYVCTDLTYFRIGVQSPSYWLGHELVIKSIDAITYEYDWGSTIGWDGPLYFQVDGDGNITYPDEWNGVAQTLNGQPLITCANNLSDLSNVPCEGSNIVIKDDVNGKDQLIMTYGYYTSGSGPREFHEVLVKK